MERSQRPRIAVISNTAPPTSGGGVGVAHYNLARALRQAGYPAELFLFFDPGIPVADEGQLAGAVHRFGPSKRLLKILRTLAGWLFALFSPGKKAWNTVDIVSSWLGTRKMQAALDAFDPDFVIAPDHGAPLLGLKLPQRTQVGLVAHHNPMRLASADLETYSELDARWAVALEQRSLAKVSKVVSPSQHMQEWFSKTYKFAGPQAVIPNIVIAEDLERVPAADLRSRLGLPANAPLVCIPSGQTAVKGSRILPQLLAGLAAKLQGPLGVFLPGELDAELEHSLPALPEAVRLYAPGRLEWEQYIAFLKGCSFGLFLSLRDNYSMALAEAVCCGVPMLAFNAGGNADIIESGVNGLLFSEPHPGLLVEAAAELVSSPGKLYALQRSTRTDAAKRFDSQKTVQEYLRFFEIR